MAESGGHGGPSSDQALDAVVSLISRIGGMLGVTVRVTLAEGGPPAFGTLTAYRLAQDGGRGGMYVNLREHPAELRITHIERAPALSGAAREIGGSDPSRPGGNET